MVLLSTCCYLLISTFACLPALSALSGLQPHHIDRDSSVLAPAMETISPGSASEEVIRLPVTAVEVEPIRSVSAKNNHSGVFQARSCIYHPLA